MASRNAQTYMAHFLVGSSEPQLPPPPPPQTLPTPRTMTDSTSEMFAGLEDARHFTPRINNSSRSNTASLQASHCAEQEQQQQQQQHNGQLTATCPPSSPPSDTKLTPPSAAPEAVLLTDDVVKQPVTTTVPIDDGNEKKKTTEEEDPVTVMTQATDSSSETDYPSDTKKKLTSVEVGSTPPPPLCCPATMFVQSSSVSLSSPRGEGEEDVHALHSDSGGIARDYQSAARVATQQQVAVVASGVESIVFKRRDGEERTVEGGSAAVAVVSNGIASSASSELSSTTTTTHHNDKDNNANSATLRFQEKDDAKEMHNTGKAQDNDDADRSTTTSSTETSPEEIEADNGDSGFVDLDPDQAVRDRYDPVPRSSTTTAAQNPGTYYNGTGDQTYRSEVSELPLTAKSRQQLYALRFAAGCR